MNRDIDYQNNIIEGKYFSYLAQYEGDVKKEFEKYPDYHFTIIDDNYLILYLPTTIEDILETTTFETIIFISPSVYFTLQDISPVKASKAEFVQTNTILNLTGKGILVAIIDTGIDYLSEEFQDINGNTRIEMIWDLTSKYSKKENSPLNPPFGNVFTKDEIQQAINLKRNGGDPYSIVPTTDTIGHGTHMAGLIGATGKNPNLKGVAPDCRFIVIKLLDDKKLEDYYDISIPIYNVTVLISALQFLYRYYIKFAKPLIIYFPLGTTLGSHEGNSLLERYIEFISYNSFITVVTGTGNERATRAHASGSLTLDNPTSLVELSVSPLQKTLICELWVDAPNIVSVDIISPSGENTGDLNYVIGTTQAYSFVAEETNIKVNYYVPESRSGSQLIRIRFFNLQPGIWKLNIIGKLIVTGGYNIWLPPRGVTLEGTNFSPADPYGTFTIPASSRFIVTAAAYNQNNNNLVEFSGVAFKNKYQDLIDIAAGGINALTVAPNNETAVVSGTSVSAAVVTGACALLYQWGIVDKNYPHLFSQTLKTFLARGVSTRPGDQYPNPQWGYGILNIYTLFQNIN